MLCHHAQKKRQAVLQSWLHLKAIEVVLWAERDMLRDSELPLGNLPSPSSHACRHLAIRTQTDLLKPNTREAFIHPLPACPGGGGDHGSYSQAPAEQKAATSVWAAQPLVALI